MKEVLNHNFIGVAGILCKEHRILLVQEKRNKKYAKIRNLWSLPGGKLKQGEDIIVALKREIMEETGFDAEPTRLISVCQLNWDLYNCLALVFEVRTIGENRSKHKQTEIKDMRWLDIDKVPGLKMKLRAGIKDILDDYITKRGFLPIDQIHS